MQNKNMLVIGIIVMFIGVSIAQTIPGYVATTTIEKIENTSSMTELQEPFNPFTTGWMYRKQIMIDHTKVAGDLNDFPVLISITDADLRDKAQHDGDDILFMNTTGIATQLYHEIEIYNSTTGELYAWVNIPSLSSSSDAIIYLYYGNPSCSSQQLPEETWDSNFCSVWHMNDLYDSTYNGNDGTNHGTIKTSGKLGTARDFISSHEDYIDWGDMPEPANSNIATATFETWVNPHNLEDYGLFLVKFNSLIEPDKTSYVFQSTPPELRLEVDPGTFHPTHDYIYGTTIDPCFTPGVWQHVVAVVDLSEETIDLYYNGVKKATEIIKIGTVPSAFVDIDWHEESGRQGYEGGTLYFDGTLDELRVSKICRSAAWISTEYTNQNNPSTFSSIGPEEILNLKTTFIIGKISNLKTDETLISFNAVNIRCIQVSPFGFIPFQSGEQIIVSEQYLGLITPNIIFAVCRAYF